MDKKSLLRNFFKIYKKIKNMHRPGIEPGSTAWKAIILPLNHRCSSLVMAKISSNIKSNPIRTFCCARDHNDQ